MFSSRLPLAALIEFCRALRHSLAAGLTVRDVVRQQSRSGPAAVRPVAARMTALLDEGTSLADALAPEADRFSPLFLALARVGEEAGMLPEVFTDLEAHFRRQQQLRRTFISLITWPVFQFVAAIGVMAALILILGLLPPMTTPQGRPYDPLGLGLSGPSGAAVFLGVIGGTGVTLFALYWLARRLMQGARADRFLLGLPAIGPCLSALALSRFCLALGLTTETGMSILRAARLALDATSNAAFVAMAGRVRHGLRGGDDLTTVLAGTGLFPDEFLGVVTVGEQSGRLPEVLRQQGEHYHEEAGRRLGVLTGLAGGLIWALVAIAIIVVIFRIFGSYLSLLDSFTVFTGCFGP